MQGDTRVDVGIKAMAAKGSSTARANLQSFVNAVKKAQ